MDKYILRFWFEHGGICVWAMNDIAKERFGYAIYNDDLPISDELINELNTLENEYHSCLDWDCPLNPSPWTKEHKDDFKKRATNTFEKLQTELGVDFIIINDISNCIYD